MDIITAEGIDLTLGIGLLIYFFLILVIGVYCARYMKSIDDFLLGGRKLGPWVTAVSERASGESAWFLLGLPGTAYVVGFREFWTVIGIALGILASWTFIALPLRSATAKMGALTLPDYFEARFGDKSRILRLVSMLIIVFFYTLYVGAQFVGGGKILNATFGINSVTGMFIGAGLVIFYTFMGGFLAVAWTDLIQGLLMAFTAIALPVLGIIKLGGFSNFTSQVATIRGPEFLSMSGGQVGKAFVFGVMFGSMAWGFGYLGQPHLLARYMAIRSTHEIRKARIIAMIWVLIAYWGAAFIGLIGLGLLGSGLSDAEQVMPLVAKSLLPSWLAGIIIAGAMAAMMSTADSQLIVATSSLAEDLYARILKPGSSQKSLIIVSRIATVVVALIALFIAMTNEELIYDLVAYAWTGLGSSFGPPLLLALLWKRVSKWGALAGMLGGTISTIIWQNVQLLNNFLDKKISTFIISLFLVFIVSLLTKPVQNRD